MRFNTSNQPYFKFPKKINFGDLRQFVSGLDEFEEGDSRCGERVLEAIQMHWIEEKS